MSSLRCLHACGPLFERQPMLNACLDDKEELGRGIEYVV